MIDRICDTSHNNTVALNTSHNNTVALNTSHNNTVAFITQYICIKICRRADYESKNRSPLRKIERYGSQYTVILDAGLY